jgi:rSAM/selenodomain-associated transferase 1
MRKKIDHSFCLAVMSKAPRPGNVKTRLVPFMTRRQASAVYEALLVNTIESVATVSDMDCQLWCSPDTRHHVFQRLSSTYHFELRRQPVGNLGQRMSYIASHVLQEYAGVIILGADCPVVDARAVEDCKRSLSDGADVVLGASEDGGYVFVGLRRYIPAVFRFVPWSTPRVLKVTANRARQAGSKTNIMQGFWDVDSPADFLRWRKFRAGRQENACVV